MEEWIVLRYPRDVPSGGFSSMSLIVADEPEIAVEKIPTSAIADLERDPKVVAAAPNMPTALIEPFASNGSVSGDAWGLQAIGADTSSYDGSGVTVAVLDTGIDEQHPAFNGVNLTVHDFTGSGKGDRNGHGTHCAGTIFGRDVGQRIGVARGVNKALIGKVLDDKGSGTSLTLIDALSWAAQSGAQIISMSLGFDFAGQVEKFIAAGWPSKLAAAKSLDSFRRNIRLFDSHLAALKAQRDLGRDCLVIAAAGNESKRDDDPKFLIPASLPSAADGAICVGALGQFPQGLRVAPFSNTLPTISAPGVDIVSAWKGGGLNTISGTSMACPHVAGIAALWWQSLGPNANSDTVRAKLVGHASFSGLAAGYNHTDVGSGLVRAP